MNVRHDLIKEVLAETPLDRLAAAVVAMQARGGAVSATRAELERFVRSLSVRELKLLRRLANALIYDGED
jgi:hypothetical protein